MFWRTQSYELLPALAVRGKHLRQSLRLVTVAWMWGVVWNTCVNGDQMRSFARMLGFNDFAFGLMGAIPFIATLGQLPAAIIVEQTGLRKYLFLNSQLVSRFLWAVLALVPFVFWPGHGGSTAAVAVALVLLFITNFLAHLATPPWWTWMGDLIPRRIRGRYFGKRSQITTGIQIVAILVISLILRHVGSLNRGHENAVDDRPLLITICAIFAVGTVFGMIDIWLFRRIREIMPPRHDDSAKPTFDLDQARNAAGKLTAWAGTAFLTRQILIDPLKDRVFRHYVCYGAAITFSMTCCGWFYWKFASETLGFDALASNVVFMAIGPVAGTLSAPWWGRMIDRWGRRPTLIVSTILMGVCVLPWFIIWRGMPCPQWMVGALNATAGAAGGMWHTIEGAIRWAWPAFGASGSDWVWITSANRGQVVPYVLASLGCILGASSGTAFALGQSAIILGFSDGHGRSKFVAASSVLINIGGTAGGIVGGLVAQWFKDVTLYVGPLALNNYQLTFALGMLVRFISLGWLWNMPDPGARKVRDLLRVWSDTASSAVSSAVLLPLRIFGWGRGAREKDSRERGPSASARGSGSANDESRSSNDERTPNDP